MDLRPFFLFMHLLGVVLWLGVSFSLSFVTAKAARQNDPNVAAFAYRAALRLTKTLGVAGVLLTLGSGIGLMVVMRYGFFRPFPHHWLFQMQLLGSVAAAIALFYQLPNAERLARAAEAWARAGEQPETFRKLRQRSAIVGSLIGFILIVLVGLGSFRLP
jgi:uncharacterized membrane protein